METARSHPALAAMVLIVAAAASGCGSPPAAAAATVERTAASPAPAPRVQMIAVVDVQRAVLATPEGMDAQRALRNDFDKRQGELDARKREIELARDAIERDKTRLPPEVVRKRTEDLQRQTVELQSSFVESNKELQVKQAELTAPIAKKVTDIIGALAKEKGYAFVFDKAAAPYVQADYDLTEDVIRSYNAAR